jgi:hypothetical protein
MVQGVGSKPFIMTPSAVGKTPLLKCLMDCTFTNGKTSTIGVPFDCLILNTYHRERKSTLDAQLIGVVLVFDLTDHK